METINLLVDPYYQVLPYLVIIGRQKGAQTNRKMLAT